MLAENHKKNAKFIRIISILRSLRDSDVITVKEYSNAKKYYQKLTGADIILID